MKTCCKLGRSRFFSFLFHSGVLMLFGFLTLVGCQKPAAKKLDIKAWVSWNVSEYMLEPLFIGNPNKFPIHFDTLSMKFNYANPARDEVMEQITTFRRGKMVSEFNYFGRKNQKSGEPDLGPPQEKSINGRTAILIPFFSVRARPSKPGDLTKMTITLLRKGKQVVQARTILPDVAKIPETADLYYMGKPKFKGAQGVPLRFVAE